MWTKSFVFHLLLALNLAEKCYSLSENCDQLQASKPPLRIIASDDEVLQPLFDKDDAESNNFKQAISPQNPSRSSRNSKSRRNKNSSKRSVVDDVSFLKMNLDLPSINSNAVLIAPKPTVNQQLDENFDSPFGSEKIKDVDIVIYRKTAPNVVSPGTIIASSSSSIAPGTIITSPGDKQSSAPISSSSLTGFEMPKIEPDSATNLFQSAKIIENRIPTNIDSISNKIPHVILPAKAKKVKSLDEYSIEGLTFDPTNTGPKINLDTNITTNFISTTLIPFFKSGKILDRKSSYSILYRAYQEFLDEESLHEIELEPDQKIIIFGDIHGQFPDFIKVIEKEGHPSGKLKYIFNGDIVDRGAYSIECLLTLLAYKIAEPNNFFISLGNHETASVGKLQFHKESIKKYGNDEFFKLSHALFKSFPTAYLIQSEVFVTHGGLSPFITLDRIRQIDRIEPDIEDEDIINDLIWSDPVSTNGTTNSHRGLGFLFGPDITREFVEKNNISVVIRSHQYKELGFSEQHDGLCITIFSCPNYKGKMKNFGAYIKIDDELNLNYNIFKAAEPNGKTEYPSIPADLKYSRNVRRIRQ